VYLESGALGRHDEEALVGLLSMTLMAAVFNTQVSLAWILAHLYSEPALLQRARDELAACAELRSYAQVEQLPFLNACIDEAVRLHTMLPGNTVLRKTKRAVQLGSHTIPAGAVLWLYPNAVHLDGGVFPEPKAFCPMRLMHGELERMQEEFELVTFGHGRKRCIGEKMARAMICAFLANTLPDLDAESPAEALPEDGFFDLVPASELRLYNLRPVGSTSAAEQPAGGAQSSRTQQQQQPTQQQPTQQPSLADAALDVANGVAREMADMVDITADMANDAARTLQKKSSKAMDLQGRRALWEFWLWLWQSWVKATDLRQSVAEALWPRGGGPRGAKKGGKGASSTMSEYASCVARLEHSLAMPDHLEDARGEDRDGAPGGGAA
jgi:hypothetical protein